MTTHSTGTTTDARPDDRTERHDLGPLTAERGGSAAARPGPSASVSLGLLLLRLVLGAVFIAHGSQKLWIDGIAATQQGFGGMGIPLPEVAAIVVTALELGGGALLILGLGTRIVAALLTINMAVAVIVVHLAAGFYAANGGYEFVLTLGVASLALVLTGPGRFALDALFRRRRR